MIYVDTTLAAVELLVCNTGRLNSILSDSHGRGRVVPTVSDRHFWEQGIPNGTAGISSIFKDHLRSEAIQPSWGSGRRTTSLGQGVCYIGIQIVYTFRIGGNWDVNTQDSSRSSYMHDNLCQLVQCIYFCCQNIIHYRGRISTNCAANTTEARLIFKVCTVGCTAVTF